MYGFAKMSKFLRGAHIGNNGVIALNTLITQVYKNNVILAGIPAKIIKVIFIGVKSYLTN